MKSVVLLVVGGGLEYLQGLPVVLLKMLQTGVLFEGIGNLYSIHLHSFLWLKAKQDSLHACVRMKYN